MIVIKRKKVNPNLNVINIAIIICIISLGTLITTLMKANH